MSEFKFGTTPGADKALAQLGGSLMACLNLARLLYALGIKNSNVGAAQDWLKFVKRHTKLYIVNSVSDSGGGRPSSA